MLPVTNMKPLVGDELNGNGHPVIAHKPLPQQTELSVEPATDTLEEKHCQTDFPPELEEVDEGPSLPPQEDCQPQTTETQLASPTVAVPTAEDSVSVGECCIGIEEEADDLVPEQVDLRFHEPEGLQIGRNLTRLHPSSSTLEHKEFSL